LLEEVIERFLHGRRALISHYLVAKLALVVEAVNRAEGVVVVVDPSGLLEKTGMISRVKDVALIITTATSIPRDKSLVLIEPGFPLTRLHNKNILATLTPGNYKPRLPSYYERIYVNKLSENLYELFFKETSERFRFRITGDAVVFEDKPSGIAGRAYEVLKNALVEYGEIRTRDAVNIISHELGVDKNTARSLLYKLVSEKYAKVVKGRVIVY